jgi:hypothetical protein
MVTQACSILQTAHTEMSDYYDQRSDAWLESDRADRFEDHMEQVADAIQALEDCFA